MGKFRKKPVIVEAVQWDGNNLDDIIKLGLVLGQTLITSSASSHLRVYCHDDVYESIMRWDWIIKDPISNNFYTFSCDDFEKYYEAVRQSMSNKPRTPEKILLDIFSIYLIGGFQYHAKSEEDKPLSTKKECQIIFDLKDLMKELKEALNNEQRTC